MPEPIRFEDLPSALGKPDPVGQWIEYFNMVLTTPALLQQYRQVRKTALGHEEWKITMQFPKALSKIDLAVFKDRMRKAGWTNLNTNLHSSGNTEVAIIATRRMTSVPVVEKPADFAAAGVA